MDNLNRVYRDQLAKRLSAALGHKHGYQDTNMAESALEWFTAYLQTHLAKCLQTETSGVCDMTWKHDHCALLMVMLHDITGEEKYKPKYSWDI